MKMLIIEDDERLAIPLKEYFEHQQYLVSMAHDGELGLSLANQMTYDVILLDLMLPKIDGMTVCRTLRQNDCSSIIVMLSARDMTANKIVGLDSGADDYLAKPFEVEELAARLRAAVRRTSQQKSSIISLGDLVLDTRTNKVINKGRDVELTPTEYRLLAHFLRNPGRTYTKEELIDRLWSSGEINTKDVIKTHVKGLRNKLAACGAPRDLITTVYGFGYSLNTNAK